MAHMQKNPETNHENYRLKLSKINPSCVSCQIKNPRKLKEEPKKKNRKFTDNTRSWAKSHDL